METSKKEYAISKLYGRHKLHQTLSALSILIIVMLVAFLCWFVMDIENVESNEGIYEMNDKLMVKVFAAGILAGAISFITFIFSSIFKYHTQLASFWYSRALALELYESETTIPLTEVISSFASEGVKLAMPTKSISELIPKPQKNGSDSED